MKEERCFTLSWLNEMFAKTRRSQSMAWETRITALLKVIFYRRISLSCWMGNDRVHTCTSKKWRFNRFSESLLKSIDCLYVVQFDHATLHSHLLLVFWSWRKRFSFYSKRFWKIWGRLVNEFSSRLYWFGHQRHLGTCISCWPCRSKWISKDFEAAW